MTNKPKFEEKVAVTTMTIEDADGRPLVFNASRSGSMNFSNLRSAVITEKLQVFIRGA